MFYFYCKTIIYSLIFFSFITISGNLDARIIKRVEFCHFIEDEGVFVKLRRPRLLAFLHLLFHENDKKLPESGECNEDTAAKRNFAIAFVDVDKDGAYDESVDVLIARYEDTNEDDLFSAGDTIYQGNYPLNFDPCPDGDCLYLGTFNLQEKVLSASDLQNVQSVAGKSLDLIDNLDNEFVWDAATFSNGSQYQIYRFGTGSGEEIAYTDWVNPTTSDNDVTRIDNNFTVIGDTFFPTLFLFQPNDDYFIQIELDNPDFQSEPGPGPS